MGLKGGEEIVYLVIALRNDETHFNEGTNQFLRTHFNEGTNQFLRTHFNEGTNQRQRC